jgi:hypothetical protein
MLVAAAALRAFGLSAAAFADESRPSSQPAAGMMGDRGGMTGMMTQMTGDQVNQMVENCNRMMAGTGGEGTDMQHPAAPPK